MEVTQQALPEGDPARYRDPVSPTVYDGAAGRLATGYDWQGGGLELSYERVDGRFLPINGIQRQAFEAWQAALHQQVTPNLGVEFTHKDRLTSTPITGEAPQRTLSDQLSATWTLPLPAPFSWASPPALRGSIRWDRTDRDMALPGWEQTTLTRTIQVQESFWQRRLTAALGYEHVIYDDRGAAAFGTGHYVAHNLVADLSANPLPEVSLTLGFRYPLKVISDPGGAVPVRVQGTQSLNVGATASRTFGAVRTSFSVGQQSGWRVSEDGTDFERQDRQATLSVTAPEVTWGVWNLSPTGRVTWSQSESLRSRSAAVGLGGGLQAAWSPVLTLRFDAARRFQLAELPLAKQTVEDRLELTALTDAWTGVEPSLTLSREVRHVVALGEDGGASPGGERRSLDTTHAAALRVGWELAPAWPQATRLGTRWTAGPAAGQGGRTAELSHTVTYRPGGPWSVSATAGASRGETWLPGDEPKPQWRADLSGQVTYRFSGQWSGGLELGYSSGVVPPLFATGQGTATPTGTPAPFRTGWIRLFVEAMF
ncbi:MAG: hypothetical protein IMX02_08290 [Limnochordaceae bacterium]|nr:hypothetical protein [Limnochordaceae bacterium]